jgi:hypothetical protein
MVAKPVRRSPTALTHLPQSVLLLLLLLLPLNCRMVMQRRG